MAAFIPINGAIVADTVYVDGTLVAKDVEFTLPEVTPVAAEVEAMGPLEIPVWQRVENMQSTITKVGFDKGLKTLLKGEPIDIEFRFVQSVTDANGNTSNVGCKAFIRAIPTSVPGLAGTPGEASSNEYTQNVLRYQLYVDGEEILTIDKLAGIARIGGTDYAKAVESLL